LGRLNLGAPEREGDEDEDEEERAHKKVNRASTAMKTRDEGEQEHEVEVEVEVMEEDIGGGGKRKSGLTQMRIDGSSDEPDIGALAMVKESEIINSQEDEEDIETSLMDELEEDLFEILN